MAGLIHKAVAVSAMAAMSLADNDKSQAERLVDALAQCQKIEAADQRLGCLDAAADAILKAREKREVVMIDRESVREAKRSLFGFSLPKIRLFGRGDGIEDAEPEVESIESTVTAVSRDRSTLSTFSLANGTQWRSTETMRVQPKAGDAIRIDAGILGSYRASVRGISAGKVKRIK